MAVDISGESDETKQLYGLNDPVTEPFRKQFLLARRLVERADCGNAEEGVDDAH